MTEFKVINGEKLRQARGYRTQEQICAAANRVFSVQLLSGYERGLYLPRPDKIPALLRALGVTFDQVASPVEEVVE